MRYDDDDVVRSSLTTLQHKRYPPVTFFSLARRRKGESQALFYGRRTYATHGSRDLITQGTAQH